MSAVALNDPQDRKDAENVAALKAMFARAREEKLVFKAKHAYLWFTPDELEEFQAMGDFCWGPASWELRNPEEWDESTARKELRGGFTLVELLAVIVIILIVSAVALPTISAALRHRQVSEASRIIQGAIVGAADAAIHANRPAGIRFVPDSSLSGIGPLTITIYDAFGNPTIIPNPYAGVLDPGQILACNRIVPLMPAPSYSEGLVSVYPTYVYPPAITNGLPCLVLEQSLVTVDGPTILPNPPTSWYWNIRIGDRVQIANAGTVYVVVGPVISPNPDGFVNLGTKAPPGGTAGPGLPEYLLLVNGMDDNGNGWTDEGFDGVDNNGDGVTDEATEWEPESWRGGLSRTVSLNLPYSIARRPVPGPNSRAVDLPSGVVIDLTTWAATLERSRPGPFFNRSTGCVDIMVNPDGTIAMPSYYSSPSSIGMSASFIHLFVCDRADLVPPSGTQAPLLPIGGISQAASAPYFGPRLSGDCAIVTIFARTGKVSVADNPPFDDPAGPLSGTYNTNQPFLKNQQGAN